MPLTEAQAVVTFANVSGFPRDSVVNTFAFTCDGSTSTSSKVTQLTAAIASFYNTAQSTTRTLAYYMSHTLKRTSNAVSVKIYDIHSTLDGTPHGSPVGEGFFTLATAASNPDLPDQVALVMTLRGFSWASQPIERPDGSDPGSEVDRPRQRYSGRLYLGPFNTAANADVADGTATRPTGPLLTTILESAQDFQNALDVNGDLWGTWSRADADVHNVVEAQVDNRWDTQRRRLLAASGRNTIAIS